MSSRSHGAWTIYGMRVWHRRHRRTPISQPPRCTYHFHLGRSRWKPVGSHVNVWRPLPSTWEGQQYSHDVILENNLWLTLLGVVRWSPGFTNLGLRTCRRTIDNGWKKDVPSASDPLAPYKALDKPGMIWIYRWSFKWPSDELGYNDMKNRDLLKISCTT